MYLAEETINSFNSKLREQALNEYELIKKRY